MLQNEKPEKEPAGTARRSKRLPLLSAILLIAVIMCCLVWRAGLLDSRSVEEQFGAIDTEFAIPDAENAAVFYLRHVDRWLNSDNVELLEKRPRSLDAEPWSDDEYPEYAAVLDRHRPLIRRWLGNLKIEKCRFSVNFASGDRSEHLDFLPMQTHFQSAMLVLTSAAANDLAEGRPDAAYDKYRCQMQMARHLLQQPHTWVKRAGIGYANAAYRNIRTAAMLGEITPERLRSLESIAEVRMERGDEFAEMSARVDRLVYRRELSQMSTIERLKQLFLGHRELRTREKLLRERRRGMESQRRATVVILALRRYKMRTGDWPESLELIEPKLADQTLVDPMNNGSFVYKREGGSFVLYSKGPGGIDEGGSWRGPDGNHPMWPPWKPK